MSDTNTSAPATKGKTVKTAAPPRSAAKGGAKKNAPAPGGIAKQVEDLKAYFEEAKGELKKITWPSRNDVRATGIAVLILCVVMSLFLGVTDLVLVRLVELILS